jgi:Zinc finger, C2H2 type
LVQSAPPSLLLSSPRGRDPTITKLVNHSSTSTRPRRGLSGWGYTNHLEPPTVPSSTTMHHQKRPSTSSSKSINSGLVVPDSLSPSLCSSTTGGSSRNSERLLKRSRQSDESLPILKRASKSRRIVEADVDTEDDSVNNDGDDDDSDDSDDYKPSRSPSLNPSRRSISPSSHSFVFKSETGVTSSTNNKKKPKKGKGKAKGSAALALAVVSQMVRNPSAAAGRRADIDLTSTRYATGITRRKNQPIPLPIPVPNLNKKSRGRKVPHVTNNDNTVMKRKSSSSSAKVYVKQEEDVEEEDDDDDDDESGDDFEDQSRSSSTRSRRKKPTPEMSKTPSGENRTFVCVVPGCGKCFIRSEHLKRHVRSIHTHDKREFFPLFFIYSSVSFNNCSSFCMVLCSSSLPF